MKKILIPIDFSDYSLNALSYARMRFEKSETTFCLFAAFKVNSAPVVTDDWGMNG